MYSEIRDGSGGVVADDVDVARGVLERARGLTFRRSIHDGYALVFEFGGERRVVLHMVFVPFDVDAIFLDSENRVTKKVELDAWTGLASGRAERVVELPAGSDVEEGDRLSFV